MWRNEKRFNANINFYVFLILYCVSESKIIFYWLENIQRNKRGLKIESDTKKSKDTYFFSRSKNSLSSNASHMSLYQYDRGNMHSIRKSKK